MSSHKALADDDGQRCTHLFDKQSTPVMYCTVLYSRPPARGVPLSNCPTRRRVKWGTALHNSSVGVPPSDGARPLPCCRLSSSKREGSLCVHATEFFSWFQNFLLVAASMAPSGRRPSPHLVLDAVSVRHSTEFIARSRACDARKEPGRPDQLGQKRAANNISRNQRVVLGLRLMRRRTEANRAEPPNAPSLDFFFSIPSARSRGWLTRFDKAPASARV